METMSVLTRSQFASAAGTGAMVALIPAAPDDLNADGASAEPADELHITMLYLGDAAEFSPNQQQVVHETATQIAGMVGRFRGGIPVKVSGIAEFGPDSDGDIAVVAVLESPIVGPMKDVLEEALASAGVENASTHPGFIPHMTVGYVPPDSPELERFREHARTLVGATVLFDKLRVVFGDDRQDHPLGGPMVPESLEHELGEAIHGDDDGLEAATLYRTAKGRWTYPENHNGADPAHNDGEPSVVAPEGATMTTESLTYSNVASANVTTTFAPATLEVIETPEVADAVGAMEIEDTDADGMVPWHGIIVVEGVKSGDFRTIAPGALTWRDLPLPMMSMLRNPDGGTGHDGAELAGRVDTIERLGHDDERFAAFATTTKPNVEIVYATGVFDPSSPGGPDTISAFRNKLMRGVSVDLDSVERLDAFAADGKTPDMQIVHGRIIGLTATPFQAFAEATIELGLVASGAESEGQTASIWTPLVASAGGARLIDAIRAGDADPPLAWFGKQTLAPGTPLTVDPHTGQVSGYAVAPWGACHISFQNRCVPVPRSKTNYAGFRCGGGVLTAEGTVVRTGPVIMDTVHPDLRKKASDAQAFYAHTGSIVANVVPYEDEYGLQIAGSIAPGSTKAMERQFRSADVSPDWRTWNGRPLETIALLAVPVSGFKDDHLAMVASGGEAGEYPVMPGEGSVWFDADGTPLAMVAAASLVVDDDDAAEIPGEDDVERKARLDAVVARFSLERKARVQAAMERFAGAPCVGLTPVSRRFPRPR